MRTKTLIMLLVAIIFYGCDTTVSQKSTGERYYGGDIEVLTIDSCEYLIFASDTRSVTHKGNCKFCIERNKK